MTAWLTTFYFISLKLSTIGGQFTNAEHKRLPSRKNYLHKYSIKII